MGKKADNMIFQQNKKRKIKVIHLYKDFDTFNGLVATFFVIAKNIDRMLFDPTICVFNYNDSIYGKKFQELGGKIINMNFNFGIKGIINTVLHLSKFLKKQKADIVVTHDRRGNFFGILAARKAGIPVVISAETTLKDTSPTRMKRLRDILFHPILSYLISLSDAFILNSESVKQQWKKQTIYKKSIVIYPPFDIDKYKEAMPAGEQAKSESRNFPTLGYVGRLSEEKGLQYLIGALSVVRGSFPSVKLLVAGTGEGEGLLKRLIREKRLDNHVTFLGFLENSFFLLKQIDLLIVPSRSEGFGMIATEGMAMGVPVIASRVGGLKEILSDGVGVLVPPQDESSLASAIISLLRNPQEMQKMRELGHKRAFEMFTPAKFIQQLEALFINQLEEKGVICYSDINEANNA